MMVISLSLFVRSSYVRRTDASMLDFVKTSQFYPRNEDVCEDLTS